VLDNSAVCFVAPILLAGLRICVAPATRRALAGIGRVGQNEMERNLHQRLEVLRNVKTGLDLPNAVSLKIYRKMPALDQGPVMKKRNVK
jgi:hypothetical protein